MKPSSATTSIRYPDGSVITTSMQKRTFVTSEVCRLHGEHRLFLVAQDLVRFGSDHPVEELAINHHRNKTPKDSSQENVHKVVSIVLGSRQGHVRRQYERRSSEKVEVDWAPSHVQQKLQLAEKPHRQEQKRRKRDGRVARRRGPHPVHQCPRPQRSRAHGNVDKRIKRSRRFGPTPSQEIGAWTAHPPLEDVGNHSIKQNRQVDAQKRHLEHMPGVVFLVLVFDKCHHCHHHKRHCRGEKKTHWARDSLHHCKRMLNGGIRQLELAVKRFGMFSHEEKVDENCKSAEPIGEIATETLQSEVR